jgi:hypothetical protein
MNVGANRTRIAAMGVAYSRNSVSKHDAGSKTLM